MGEVVETEAGRFWLDEEGFLRVIVKPIDQTAAHAQETLRVLAQLGGGTKRPGIIDGSQIARMSREVRMTYTGEQSAELWSAVAVVVTASAVARSVVNFAIVVSRPRFPTRLFDDVNDARAWARGYLRKDAGHG